LDAPRWLSEMLVLNFGFASRAGCHAREALLLASEGLLAELLLRYLHGCERLLESQKRERCCHQC
jgi:hypothetical protein